MFRLKTRPPSDERTTWMSLCALGIIALLQAPAIAVETNDVPSNEPSQRSTDLFETFAYPTIDYSEQEHWLLDNLRFTIDLSSRVTHSTARDTTAAQHAFGFDLHKVFSGPNGDWGTLLLQGYVTRLDNQNPHAFFFEDDDDWEFVYRIFNFNYTGLSQGAFNIRVGHYEIPFGIEHLVNTNGTLRQYAHGNNIGVKADWGISVNGELPDFEYEVGLSRGTGNEYFNTADPYIIAGRIGTPRDQNLILGLSAMHGRVASPSAANNFVRRTRVAGDIHWRYSQIEVLAELAVGRNFQTDVANGLLEVNWRDHDEHWLVYLQGRSFHQRVNGWDEAHSTAMGVRFTPDNHWALSMQYSLNFSAFNNGPRNSVVSVQARYRF